jgi:cation diffusion facilitator family transporter
MFTVLVALAANAGIGVAKLFAGVLSGSSALMSEAAHSAGDTCTELLLVTALRRSERPADRVHPFGYGKERYFWSLIAAVAIFVSGAAFSVWEGVRTIVGGNEPLRHAWVNYAVLLVAFVLEGSSFVRAVRHTREEADHRRRSAGSYIRDPDDPTIKSVVLEDSAALIGIVIAAVGVALHQLTGNSVWDGIASLMIGGLLVVAAFLLAQTCKALLIGKQADPRLLRAIERTLEEQPEIIDVVDIVTMMVGTDRILVGARVDFADEYSSAQLEEACVRTDGLLRDRYTGLDEIFIQPVPREDPELRARVMRRYGRSLAD